MQPGSGLHEPQPAHTLSAGETLQKKQRSRVTSVTSQAGQREHVSREVWLSGVDIRRATAMGKEIRRGCKEGSVSGSGLHTSDQEVVSLNHMNIREPVLLS